MASGRAALAMLTRFPVGSTTGDVAGASWFGVVGVLVGVGGFVPLVLLGTVVPAGAAFLALGIMAALSGALHLDGLADTADALLAMGPDAAERARKDPSIGAGGAVALILVLGLEAASLATLATASGVLVAGLACLVGGATSRAVPVVVAFAVRPRVAGAGLGAVFARQVDAADVVLVAATAVAVALAAAIGVGRPLLLAGGLAGGVAGVGLGLVVVRLRGRLDGDGLGATVELGFAAVMLATAALGRWPVA